MQFPTDMQDLPCDETQLRAVSAQRPPASRPPPDAIELAAELVAAAKRPAIIAGRGAVRANARQSLENLAERIGALLATSAQAKGLFMGNPFYLGSSGGFASPLGEKFLPEADLILAFGASLNHWTTRNRELFAESARIIHCDVERSAIGALTPVDLGLAGDAAASAEALSGELARRDINAIGFRTPEVRREISAFASTTSRIKATAAQ